MLNIYSIIEEKEGVINIPKELLRKLGFSEGKILLTYDEKNGFITLIPINRPMKIGLKMSVQGDGRNILKILSTIKDRKIEMKSLYTEAESNNTIEIRLIIDLYLDRESIEDIVKAFSQFKEIKSIQPFFPKDLTK